MNQVSAVSAALPVNRHPARTKRSVSWQVSQSTASPRFSGWTMKKTLWTALIGSLIALANSAAGLMLFSNKPAYRMAGSLENQQNRLAQTAIAAKQTDAAEQKAFEETLLHQSMHYYHALTQGFAGHVSDKDVADLLQQKQMIGDDRELARVLAKALTQTSNPQAVAKDYPKLMEMYIDKAIRPKYGDEMAERAQKSLDPVLREIRVANMHVNMLQPILWVSVVAGLGTTCELIRRSKKPSAQTGGSSSV